MAAAKKTPIDPAMIAEAVQGVAHRAGSWLEGWFGPGEPVSPSLDGKQAESVRGRQFDFPASLNTRRIPRDGEGVTFDQMRALADGYDLMRLIIERRKDQMSKMRWSFALKPHIEKQRKAEERLKAAKKKLAEQEAEPQEPPPQPGGAPGATEEQPAGFGAKPPKKVQLPEVPKRDPRIEELENFFAFPDQEHDWDTWLRMLLEDMLVIDAATVYPRLTNGGDLFSLEPVDGATVKRLIDMSGRTPLPPEPAYQQVIKGVPVVEYNRDELLYRPRNLRTNKIYGFSPVEQVIMTVNIALRRQLHQLQYYTEGNVPEMMFGVPPTWNPDQIKTFQTWWDSLMEGNTAERRHAKFVPGDIKPIMTKEGALKDEYDEWLARIVCFAFSIDPTPFTKNTNRATAESAKEQALSEGLAPVQNWVKNTVDLIVWKYFGYLDLEFRWEEEDASSPKVQAEILCSLVEKKILFDDEARDKLGYDPKTDEQREAEKAAIPPMLQAPPGEDEEGGSKPGKSQAASLAKAARPKQLSRNRRAQVQAAKAIKKAFASALSDTADAVGAALRATEKAMSPRDRADEIVARVDLTSLARASAVVQSALTGSFADGFKAAGTQIKAGFNDDQLKQANERAVAWAETRAADLVKQVEDSTKEYIRMLVAGGLDEGLTNDEIADALAESFAFSSGRAETIARTETADADVQGNLDAYRESGLVYAVEWITQGEVCDECDALDGKVAPIGGVFPGGSSGPPLHPNCRCDILPVLSTQPE